MLLIGMVDLLKLLSFILTRMDRGYVIMFPDFPKDGLTGKLL